MKTLLPDTNIFSQIFKGNAQLKTYIETTGAVICSTIYIENIQGSKSNQEKRVIKKYLDNFSLLLIDTDTSQLAIELIDKYSNTHGLLLGDAQIAATALENDLTILTYNVADFKFIQNLKWEKPPI
ncbi:MAG: PIN domain-containing protein [Pyrinomonadaceae bacterium]|nr:PIN domain-containing protein [Pyrinomonadaceae bacterium]